MAKERVDTRELGYESFFTALNGVQKQEGGT